MKKWFLIITIIMLILTTCKNPAEDINNGNNNKPSDQKTIITFDNTQGICNVSVFFDHNRRPQDKIADIPAGQMSQEIEWTPSNSTPFYFTYHINLKGIGGFTLDFIPEIGKDQTVTRIDANKKTNIRVHKLNETLSSQNNYYLITVLY